MNFSSKTPALHKGWSKHEPVFIISEFASDYGVGAGVMPMPSQTNLCFLLSHIQYVKGTFNVCQTTEFRALIGSSYNLNPLLLVSLLAWGENIYHPFTNKNLYTFNFFNLPSSTIFSSSYYFGWAVILFDIFYRVRVKYILFICMRFLRAPSCSQWRQLDFDRWLQWEWTQAHSFKLPVLKRQFSCFQSVRTQNGPEWRGKLSSS